MTLKHKLRRHFSDWWHWIDTTIFLIFFIAIYLRINKTNESTVNTSFAFVAFFSILQLLKAFYAFRTLGPYIIMIARMVSL